MPIKLVVEKNWVNLNGGKCLSAGTPACDFEVKSRSGNNVTSVIGRAGENYMSLLSSHWCYCQLGTGSLARDSVV